MAYCKNCGAEIPDNAFICVKCGVQQKDDNKPVDTGSIGWWILGFLIPIIGLILYLVWKDDKPVSAKQAGQGALVSVLLGVVIIITYFVLVASAIASMPYY